MQSVASVASIVGPAPTSTSSPRALLSSFSRHTLGSNSGVQPRLMSTATVAVPRELSEVSGSGSRLPSVSLKWVTIALLCVFAAVPAVSLSLASWSTGQRALSAAQDLTDTSLEVVVGQMRDTLTESVIFVLTSIAVQTDALARSTATMVLASGLLDLPGAQVRANASALLLPLQKFVLYALQANDWALYHAISILPMFGTGAGAVLPTDYSSISGVWLNVNLRTQVLESTLIRGVEALNSSLGLVRGQGCVLDSRRLQDVYCYGTSRDTADILENLRNAPEPVRNITRCEMSPHISFMPITGIPHLTVLCTVPSEDQLAML
eukprot:RCo023806